MRCPDCNKFVGLELQDPEEQTLDVDKDGNVSGSVRIVRNCSECNQELKEAGLDIEVSVADEIEAHRKEHPECKDSELSVKADLEPVEDMQTTDRRGNRIKNPRYMKSLFGARADITVTCDHCGAEFTTEWQDTVSASSMDELA